MDYEVYVWDMPLYDVLKYSHFSCGLRPGGPTILALDMEEYTSSKIQSDTSTLFLITTSRSCIVNCISYSISPDHWQSQCIWVALWKSSWKNFGKSSHATWRIAELIYDTFLKSFIYLTLELTEMTDFKLLHFTFIIGLRTFIHHSALIVDRKFNFDFIDFMTFLHLY